MKKEIISTIKLLVIFSIYALLAYCIGTYVEAKIFTFIIISCFIFYSYFVVKALDKIKDDDKKWKVIIVKVFAIPILLILAPLKLILTISPILIAILFYFMCSVATPILFSFILYAYDVKLELIQFLFLTATSIISVVFHTPISRFVIKKINIFLKGFGEKIKNSSLNTIEYLFKVDNVRFLLYLLYFIFLVTFSVKSIVSPIREEITDFVLLQAFLVFLAFDNIKLNSKNLNLKPSKLYEYISYSFYRKDKS